MRNLRIALVAILAAGVAPAYASPPLVGPIYNGGAADALTVAGTALSVTLPTLATGAGLTAEAATARAAEALKAPLASPALTGLPTAPTASCGDNSTKLATTAYVAACGGSGGSGTIIRLVATGTSDTSTDAVNTAIKWTSTTAANKAQGIPACAAGNKSLILIVKDGAGTAASYPITITPVSGTIDGAATLVINTTRSSRTLQCDGVSDWTVE